MEPATMRYRAVCRVYLGIEGEVGARRGVTVTEWCIRFHLTYDKKPG